MAKKLDKLKAGLVNKDEITLPNITNIFTSKIDYQKLGINQEDKEFLVEREALLIHTGKEIAKNLSEQSKALYEAQERLSRTKGGEGIFISWFTELGLDKNYVYRAINAYNMFLSYNTNKVFSLPIRVREEIIKKKDNFNEAEIIEIINDEKPQLKLKEIEKEKIEKEELEKYNNIDNDLEKYKLELKEQKNKIYDKKIELEKIKIQYDKIKNELQELKEIEKELSIKIKIIKQEI